MYKYSLNNTLFSIKKFENNSKNKNNYNNIYCKNV